MAGSPRISDFTGEGRLVVSAPMHKHLVVSLLLAATTAGCQVKPGDYRIYRLAFNEVSGSCSDDLVDDMRHTHSDTTFVPSLIAVYAADTDTYFLEDGARSLVGERDGNGYTFVNTEVWNDKWGMEEGQARMFESTRTVEEVWDLDLKGKGLSGRFTVDSVTACSGTEDDCVAVGYKARSCSSVVEVFGSVVDDIDIEYVLAGGGLPDDGGDT